MCNPLITIPHGNVSYQIENTTEPEPGDVVLYYCDDLYQLEGTNYRVCLKNGTWTEKEPKCIGEYA